MGNGQAAGAPLRPVRVHRVVYLGTHDELCRGGREIQLAGGHHLDWYAVPRCNGPIRGSRVTIQPGLYFVAAVTFWFYPGMHHVP